MVLFSSLNKAWLNMVFMFFVKKLMMVVGTEQLEDCSNVTIRTCEP